MNYILHCNFTHKSMNRYKEIYIPQKKNNTVRNKQTFAISYSSSSSSRACPILERSRFHCPLPPFTILSPLPSWHQADVEWPQVLFSGTEPSSSRSTGRSFPIAWQSRNDGSKNTCMVLITDAKMTTILLRLIIIIIVIRSRKAAKTIIQLNLYKT